MQRISPRTLFRFAPPCRQLSTSLVTSSKASKARISSKPKNTPHPALALQGTGAEASPRLYSAEEPVVGQKIAEPEAKEEPTAKVERELLEAQGGLTEPEPLVEVKERLRGTGVGASNEAYEAGEKVVGRDEARAASSPDFEPRAFPALAAEPQESTEEETIYTANPPFNVPLLLTASFVFATFSLTAADTARVGLTDYNEETEEYELAPAWKRYIFSGGLTLVAGAIIWWGSLAPGRIITKLTIKRPLTSASPSHFPRDALITLHTPITRFPGLSPRTVPLSSIHLVGPLSTRPRSYHPVDYEAPARPLRTDPISSFFRRISKLLIAPARPSKPKNPWTKGGGLSHSPILIAGDRATYSLAVKRGPTGLPGDPKGAWCEDWEGLERALLNVEEEK